MKATEKLQTLMNSVKRVISNCERGIHPSRCLEAIRKTESHHVYILNY